MKILGLANNMYLSSAALLVDGNVVAGAAEERFTRQKGTKAFPAGAIDYCLRSQNVSLDDIDYVSVSADPGVDLSVPNKSYSQTARWYPEALLSIPNNLARFMSGAYVGQTWQTFSNGKNELRICYVYHHHAHAANGFFLSPFDDAAILTVDGRGEDISGYMGIGHGNDITQIDIIKYPHSLGLLYGTITRFLGYQMDSDEWKVMALAACGSKQSAFYNKLKNLVTLLPRGQFELDLSYLRYYLQPSREPYADKLIDLLGTPRRPDEPFARRHYDIAAALQQVTEETLLHMLDYLYSETGLEHLVVSGGVFMNSVFNGKIEKLSNFRKVFVSSCPDDSGTSIGAALYLYRVLLGQSGGSVQGHNYYGPEYSDEEISATLETFRIPATKTTNLESEVARMLAAGKIVGWFQGRMEFGQRALGNRSILADPRRADMKDLINAAVKFRESYRPFAPSVLEADFCGIFDTGSRTCAPFMAMTFPVKPHVSSLIPSVIHVDGTSRPQSVSINVNKRLHKLLTEFKQLTGVGALLNTSFNRNGEPIVCTPTDALKTFVTSGLDVLAIGDHIVSKDSMTSQGAPN